MESIAVSTSRKRKPLSATLRAVCSSPAMATILYSALTSHQVGGRP